MTDWIPVTRMNDTAITWIKPEMVVRVDPGSGQRTIGYKGYNGEIAYGVRPYGFSDDEFMRRLGLPTERERMERLPPEFETAIYSNLEGLYEDSAPPKASEEQEQRNE